jgi:LacI family transcriptional regulator
MNLRELAGLLDLSVTTVSRALNGYPEVNDDTRARVVAAARRHGYSPNLVARRLATGRAQAIGHVIPLADHQMINPIFADFLAGAGEAYSAAGYDMILSVVPQAEEVGAYRTMATQRKVDGVIVHAPRLRDGRIDLLTELGLPFLVHGRDGRPDPDYRWLDTNNRRAFLRATQYLLDLGHTRIALLNGLESMHFAHRRRTGYEDALTARGIAPDADLMRSGEMVESFGHENAAALLASDAPPTAFLCSSIMIALGAMRAIREAGLEPGGDVSIVTHDDDISFLRNSGPRPLFTATRCPIRRAGTRAAEMLIASIDDPDSAPRSELLEAELVIGQSTGPCGSGQSLSHARLRG